MHRLILALSILVGLLGSTEAAACQACLFSIPLATRSQHQTPTAGGGIRAYAASAFLPFGLVAARHFYPPRYRSLLLRSEDTEEAKGDEVSEESSDVKEEPVVSAIAIGAIGVYKNFISPLLPPACRFVPTCSQYGVQAIQEFGATQGCVLIAWRLLRCSPLGGKGYDPPKWPPVPYTYSSY